MKGFTMYKLADGTVINLANAYHVYSIDANHFSVDYPSSVTKQYADSGLVVFAKIQAAAT